MFSKTARKRQIGPNGLLASTPRTFSNTCVFADVCSFRLYVVIGALPAPSLHQNELFASTACTFSKHVILMIFVKTQPYVVMALLCPSLRRPRASCERPWLAKVVPASPFTRPRRTTQRTVVSGGRPVPRLPQNCIFTSTACTFSTTCVCLHVFVLFREPS